MLAQAVPLQTGPVEPVVADTGLFLVAEAPVRLVLFLMAQTGATPSSMPEIVKLQEGLAERAEAPREATGVKEQDFLIPVAIRQTLPQMAAIMAEPAAGAMAMAGHPVTGPADTAKFPGMVLPGTPC